PRDGSGAALAAQYRELSRSERRAHGQSIRTRIAGLPNHQARVAGLRREEVEVLLVERVANPAVHIPTVAQANTGAEIGDRVAIDIRVDRARRVRRELRAIQSIESEVPGAVAAKRGQRQLILHAVRCRDLRDTR